MTIFVFVIMLGVITVVLAIRLTAREDRGYRLLGYQHRLFSSQGVFTNGALVQRLYRVWIMGHGRCHSITTWPRLVCFFGKCSRVLFAEVMWVLGRWLRMCEQPSGPKKHGRPVDLNLHDFQKTARDRQPTRLSSEPLWVQMMPQRWFNWNNTRCNLDIVVFSCGRGVGPKLHKVVLLHPRLSPDIFPTCRMCKMSRPNLRIEPEVSVTVPFYLGEARRRRCRKGGLYRAPEAWRRPRSDEFMRMLGQLCRMHPVQKSWALHLQVHWCRNWSARLTGLSWVLHGQSS